LENLPAALSDVLEEVLSSPAEPLLISAILRTRGHNIAVSRGINKEMFYGYRDEFEWIDNYYSKYGKCPSIGAFRQVFDDFPFKKVDDIELYIEEVRDSHARQVVLKGLNDVTSKLKSGDIRSAIKQLSSVSLSSESALLGHGSDGDIFQDYTDIEEDISRRVSKVNDTGFSGIPTGIPTLDELTGGIQPGWFVVFTARAGVGKTRSLIRMACAAAFSGYTVQYDALEQSRPEIAFQVQSFASSEFGNDIFKSLDLAQGRVDMVKYKEFLRNNRGTIQGKMHVADSSRNSIGPSTIAAQIERNKVDLVCLDHLTILDGADDWQSAANLSTSLARVAKRYRVPIVTAAQINRNGVGRDVQGLGDIAGTDRIGQDADLVINIQEFSKSVLSMTIVKFRHGPSGQRFFLKFDPNMGVMEEITYEEAIDLKDVDEDRKDKQKSKKFVARKKGSFHQMAVARKIEVTEKGYDSDQPKVIHKRPKQIRQARVIKVKSRS
jgi:replicative DNA helicase